MKQITLSDFRELSMEKMRETLPCIITASIEHREIKPFLIAGKPEDVIVVSDLPILMKNKILSIEQMARSGMPQPEVVETQKAEEVITTEPAPPEVIAEATPEPQEAKTEPITPLDPPEVVELPRSEPRIEGAIITEPAESPRPEVAGAITPIIPEEVIPEEPTTESELSQVIEPSPRTDVPEPPNKKKWWGR